MTAQPSPRNINRYRLVFVSILAAAAAAGGALIPMTFNDFHEPGTQVGEIGMFVVTTSDNCLGCHSDFDPVNEPHATWKGSLMGIAGRDPLFYAQMATANQDVANVGYYCLRCHVPMSFITGHAYQPDGSTLDNTDMDGVGCHFCHAMVDPIYKPGVSPPEDWAILDELAEVPQHYGNAMFVLDPTGLRRGPFADPYPPLHAAIYAPFQTTGDFCGTCHDVGNLAVTRQPDGTYAYNAIDAPSPTFDPHGQFPLERTYTEWKLSDFANGGVDMGGRFGGEGPTVVSTCQDCHMPKATARACLYGEDRLISRHDFAGASAWVLEIAGLYYQNDPNVNQAALLAGRQKAIDMLQRAASLELTQAGAVLTSRVINESGHKIPTGHIEGRRIWVNVQIFDADDLLLLEYGHYDDKEAHLDDASTTVYEMHVGLSPAAAQATGLPAGVTTHMALADTIEKDSRIPPRGFNNTAYEAAGAPAVGVAFADGQYWHDTPFWLPEGAARAVVSVYYQTVTRHYIEALRDGNVTDHWGDTLYQLWLDTDKCPPVLMTSTELLLAAFTRGDGDGDGDVDLDDYSAFAGCMTGPGEQYADPGCAVMDDDGDRDVDTLDFAAFQAYFTVGVR